MIDTPQIVQTDEQPAAVIHLVVSCAEIALAMDSAIAEVLSALAAQGIAPAGPYFSFHMRRPTDTFDFEVGFPVDRPLNPGGRVKMGKLPAAKVARTVYRGGYEGLGTAWGKFCAWLDAEGLSPQDCLWERYVSGPESTPDPATWQTELNRPLAP
jgi:effector-binding domain-containing protein